MNQSTGIHCKIICDGQIRRFQFSFDEFPSLQKQVKQLLGLNREFSLKYKDNEGDMITLSSTEELSCAIEISRNENGGLLRLAVFFQTEPLTETQQPSHVHSDYHEFGGSHHHHGNGYGGKWGHHGRGGHGHHHEFRNSFKNFDKPGCQFGSQNENTWKAQKQCRFGSEPHCQNKFEKKKDKLMFKRDMFNAYLNSLEQNKELSPEDQRRKKMFLIKVQKIDSVLEQFYSTKKMDQPQNEKSCSLNQGDVMEVQDFKKMDQPQSCTLNQRDVMEVQDQKKMDLPQIEKTNTWSPRDVGEFQYPKKMDFEKKNSWNQRNVADFQHPKKNNCQYKNFEKKERKFEKNRDHKEFKKEKRDFKNKSEISEEAKQEIISLKNQIKELKPLIWSIDDKMKTKKEDARKSFENGELPENFKIDIGKLKQEKRVIKEKITSVYQRIYELKTRGK